MNSPWTVHDTGDGWRLQYRGRWWPGSRATKAEAEAYRDRLVERYPHGSALTVLGAPDAEDKGRQRGGPWRFTYPTDDGEETGVINMKTKKDAKMVLRSKLGRKRLPNGIEWEIEP